MGGGGSGLMGSITGALGLNNQQEFNAGNTGMITPFNQQQINNAANRAENALGAQWQLYDALNAQQGIGNQSNAYQMALQQAVGQGPNPAQAQLAQATAANTANQAALMAGQRSTGSNAGLMARQIAMQGANNQQNAAGQAATLQAQQQLQGQQLAAQIANQQVAQQQGLMQQYNAGAQGNLNALTAGMGGQNQNAAQLANMNMQVQQGNMQTGKEVFGGLLSAAGASMQPSGGGGGGGNAGGMQAKAHGGIIHPAGPRSNLHKCLVMKSGGPVPGHAKVAGDSEANDTVSAKLSPGEIVIPRSIVNAKNAPEAAAKFVAAVLAKQGKKA